jgi:hypothetical protein
MATWTETVACVRDCIDRFEPLTLDRFACILDCYERKAKQLVGASVFPPNTPVTVQTAGLPVNGKDNMEVFLLLLNLMPPEQFQSIPQEGEIEQLLFQGQIIVFSDTIPSPIDG